MSEFRNELQQICDAEWNKIKSGLFFDLVKNEVELDLYIITMVQVYHYTKNNAINQAVAAFQEDHKKVGLLRFGMKHALEELGHENMVVNDLMEIGVHEKIFENTRPLPATEALNGYLDSVAIKGGIVARLGYSFWAEASYHHVYPLLDACQNKLMLTEKQLTFFIAHAVIDEKHADDVNNAIDKWVISEEQKESVRQVARTTLFLMGQILEAVAQQYMGIRNESCKESA